MDSHRVLALRSSVYSDDFAPQIIDRIAFEKKNLLCLYAVYAAQDSCVLVADNPDGQCWCTLANILHPLLM